MTRGRRRFSGFIARSAATGRKILDIVEGIQQIQKLIIVRRLLAKISAELK